LNIVFTVVELVGCFWTNILAILSDALNDFGDITALLSLWRFYRGAQKSPDTVQTFGYKGLSLFSALFSASILIGGSFALSYIVTQGKVIAMILWFQ
jgi:cobalt-zinc-cadmium efflux system protein